MAIYGRCLNKVPSSKFGKCADELGMCDISCLPLWLNKGLFEELGIKKLTPIQEKTVPFLLSDNSGDCFVYSPTGTGKTLAYALPIVARLVDRRILATKAVIVVPTKSLVEQTERVFESLLSFQSKYRVFEYDLPLLLTVGSAYEIVKNVKNSGSQNYQQPDILVSTPRLIIDLVKNYNFSLSHLEYLVLDEIDELLNSNDENGLLSVLLESIRAAHDTNFIDLNEQKNILIDAMKRQKRPMFHKLCFSATKTSNPGKLACIGMSSPTVIVAEEFGKDDSIKYALPSSLCGYYLETEANKRSYTILHLINRQKLNTGLIFLASLRNIERVHKELKRNIRHLNMNIRLDVLCSRNSEEEKKKILGDLKKSVKTFGIPHFIICTDMGSRGIDIPGMDCVINYDVPIDIKTYVHRAGRTARVDKKGSVFTIISPGQFEHFISIVKKLGNITPEKIELGHETLSN